MEALVDAGKARHIGVSNMTVSKLENLFAEGVRIPPAVNQVEMHPMLAQGALVEYCRGKGILVTA